MAAEPVMILMPVYNAVPYLPTALDSLLAQTYTNWTLLWVDDGSTDHSCEILHSYMRRDRRITTDGTSALGNVGLARTLNHGLAYCTTKWVARMDADDYSHPDRLAKQMRFLAQHPDTILLGTCGWQMDVAGGRGAYLEYPTEHEAIRRQLRYRNPFLHSSVIFRRSIVKQLGGYNESLRYCPDFDLWRRMARIGGRLANLTDLLVGYRRHVPGSLSARYPLLKWWENLRVVMSG